MFPHSSLSNFGRMSRSSDPFPSDPNPLPSDPTSSLEPQGITSAQGTTVITLLLFSQPIVDSEIKLEMKFIGCGKNISIWFYTSTVSLLDIRKKQPTFKARRLFWENGKCARFWFLIDWLEMWKKPNQSCCRIRGWETQWGAKTKHTILMRWEEREKSFLKKKEEQRKVSG